MTREEHLAWAKKRALEYLPSDVGGAFASMSSDLQKHPELKDHIGISLGISLLMCGHLTNPQRMREWIEGFN
jgi:hypothetical protein